MVSIASNIAAFNAQGNIGVASNSAAASIARLSSGNRITKASDDVAGLAIGTSLRTQVTTLRTSLQNASQGTSLLQVADGGLSQIVDILQRQKALAVQAGSGSLTDSNRALLNQEFQNLTGEIDRIAAGTSFNNVSLLNGTLGVKTRLVTTDAMAGGGAYYGYTSSNPTGGLYDGTAAIQAFDTNTNQLRAGTGTAGFLQLTNSSGTVLANSAYDGVDASVYGQFSNFVFSNVTYGAVGTGSGTLTATLNGVQYSGNVVSSGNATALLSNGNTYINVGLGAVTLTDAGTTSASTNNIITAFSTTIIERTNTLVGLDFSGTSMSGITGPSRLRMATSGPVSIGNFQYLSNKGPNGNSLVVNGQTVYQSNLLSVQVNDQTWYAPDVYDYLSMGTLQFLGPGGQALIIQKDGITNDIVNIRTNITERTNFINALNTAFSRSGSALNYTVGSTNKDTIRIGFGSATTASLYNGKTLDVASATSAANASVILDNAITQAVSLRATVGALQSRFNAAGNAIQSAIESQDAARSTLLDTDVAAESSAFASAQVRLKAGIAVLAQANKLSTNLLKLLQ